MSRIHVCVGYKCVLGTSVCWVQVCWDACVCRIHVFVLDTSVCLGKVCVRDMKSWVQLRGEETKADGTNFFEILDFFPF